MVKEKDAEGLWSSVAPQGLHDAVASGCCREVTVMATPVTQSRGPDMWTEPDTVAVAPSTAGASRLTEGSDPGSAGAGGAGPTTASTTATAPAIAAARSRRAGLPGRRSQRAGLPAREVRPISGPWTRWP